MSAHSLLRRAEAFSDWVERVWQARKGALLGALGLTLALASGGESAFLGSLTQLAGTDACVSETGGSGVAGRRCTDGTALDWPFSVAVSPDGRHAYVASYQSSAVAVFARDEATGALTQLAGTAGCVSETGTGGRCADGQALSGAQSVAVSPDGWHVYVASNGGIAVFARDAATGALTQLPGIPLGAISVVVSPDGWHVYVTSGDGVAVFARDAATGTLTQLPGTAGCVSDDGTGGLCADGRALLGARSVAVSPDGSHAYVASVFSNAVAVFARDKTTGALTQLPRTAGCVSETGFLSAQMVWAGDTKGSVWAADTKEICAPGRALLNAQSVAVSPDGGHVYVASSHTAAIAVFARDKTTGRLTQLPGSAGCVNETEPYRNPGPPMAFCAEGRAITLASSVAVSRDGSHVYVGSVSRSAVAVFARDQATGALTQLPGTAGCVSSLYWYYRPGLWYYTRGPCAAGAGLVGAMSVVLSPDDRHVYVASYGALQTSGAVAVFARE